MWLHMAKLNHPLASSYHTKHRRPSKRQFIVTKLPSTIFLGGREQQVERPCGQGPSAWEELKTSQYGWIPEHETKRHDKESKGIERQIMQIVVHSLRAQGKINEEVQAREQTRSALGRSRPHTESGLISEASIQGNSLWPHTGSGLQDDGTSPGLELQKKQVLLKKNNPNKMDSKVKKGE